MQSAEQRCFALFSQIYICAKSIYGLSYSRAAILWFRQNYCPRTYVTLGPGTPPLKVFRGHMSNIQYTHMEGGLDVPGPHVKLGPGTPSPLLKVSPLPFQFGLMQKQETKGGGLRTAVASALLLV